MTTLVELSNRTHENVKINRNAAFLEQANQQVLGLRVSELGAAATNFPLFLMPNITNGRWTINALTSFAPQSNLFLTNGTWQATYLPQCISTYPFFLMNSVNAENNYTVGIDAGCRSLSDTEGEALFTADGTASPYLSQITRKLNGNLPDTLLTAEFITTLEQLKLLKGIDLVVYFDDETAQNMTGLNTIDEDALKILSADQLEKLNDKGFLLPMHALLISLYQVNALIQKNNSSKKHDMIEKVKFEVKRDKNSI